ncbi:MAG: ATP-binding protein [Verrucomicrobiales bacterium]|nr:ATP-binding protein [Verrucomicrobiales bacterium]
MIEFFTKLLDTSDFPARWNCGNWETGHGWLHIISDSLIFGAYTAIPLSLLVVAWKRHREILFEKLVWLFALFILACGVGHLIEATIFWNPWYRLSGVSKAFTALVSWATAIAIMFKLPEALQIPSMASMNNQLRESLDSEHQAVKELERSNQDLDEFAYAASHDLKAPLRSIQNLSSWIEEDCADILPEESKRHLEQLQQRVGRLDRLLEDILTYSRAGRDLPENRPVELNGICDHVLNDLRLSVPGFTIERKGDLPTVLSSEVPWEQILSNLIGNAIKHHDKESGQITISSDRGKKTTRITVADDGPGIPPEYREKIFEMFATLQSKDETEGSGIGLSLVRKLTDRMDAKIGVESQPGEGSRFSVLIPNTMLVTE